MNVLIISPGTLPITKDIGGAIQNLVNIYLKYNECKNDKIVVYSVKLDNYLYDDKIYKNTEFRNIDKSKIFSKVKILLNKIQNKIKIKNSNYFIEEVVKDLIRRNEQNKYEVIIFENGVNYIEYFIDNMKCDSKKILHLHNDYLNVDTKNSKKIFNLFDEIWCVSNFLKNRVSEISTASSKVKCLYNTINFEKFLINSQKTKDIINNIKISEDDFVFLYVGRVYKEKGVMELIKAFNEINKIYSNVKLIIVGGAKKINKNKDDFYKKIKQEAGDNIFFSGQVNNAETYKYYNASDIQVIPSICNEAFGLIALEGISCNLPCITTGAGGLKEIYNESALYVDKDDLVNDLINKMKYSIENYDEMKEKIKNYPAIIDKFSVAKYNANFYNFVHENKSRR